MEAKEKVRAFFAARCLGELDDDDDIFATGVVNSLLAMQLVLFVEQEFRIQISNEDLVQDNFRSVNAITRLVERHVA